MSHNISNLTVSGLNSSKINGVAIFIKDDNVTGYRAATPSDFGGQVQLTGLNKVGLTGVVEISGTLTANNNLKYATVVSKNVASVPVELLDYSSYSGLYISGLYASIRYKIWNDSTGILTVSEYTGATGSLISSNLFSFKIPSSGLYENNVEYFGPVYGWFSAGSGLVNSTIYYTLK